MKIDIIDLIITVFSKRRLKESQHLFIRKSKPYIVSRNITFFLGFSGIVLKLLNRNENFVLFVSNHLGLFLTGLEIVFIFLFIFSSFEYKVELYLEKKRKDPSNYQVIPDKLKWRLIQFTSAIGMLIPLLYVFLND